MRTRDNDKTKIIDIERWRKVSNLTRISNVDKVQVKTESFFCGNPGTYLYLNVMDNCSIIFNQKE